MKKLVNVMLAPNDTGVLFSLSSPGQDIREGGRIATNGVREIIEKDSYSEIERGSYSELMRGDGLNEREGVIIYASKKEYEELKKQGRVD